MTIAASQCRSLICPQPVTHLFHVIASHMNTLHTSLTSLTAPLCRYHVSRACLLPGGLLAKADIKDQLFIKMPFKVSKKKKKRRKVSLLCCKYLLPLLPFLNNAFFMNYFNFTDKKQPCLRRKLSFLYCVKQYLKSE